MQQQKSQPKLSSEHHGGTKRRVSRASQNAMTSAPENAVPMRIVAVKTKQNKTKTIRTIYTFYM